MTEWKPIERFNGLYLVSDDGRIGKVTGGSEPKIMARYFSPQGYAYTQLRWGGKVVAVRIHREMGIAFLPNPEGYPQVRHLDDDKSNNVIKNLAWGTPRMNALDSIRNGTHAVTNAVAAATHCVNGLHERTPENFVTRTKPDGRTVQACKGCEDDRGRASREKTRERRAKKERERRAAWTPEQREANRQYMREYHRKRREATAVQ